MRSESSFEFDGDLIIVDAAIVGPSGQADLRLVLNTGAVLPISIDTASGRSDQHVLWRTHGSCRVQDATKDRDERKHARVSRIPPGTWTCEGPRRIRPTDLRWRILVYGARRLAEGGRTSWRLGQF